MLIITFEEFVKLKPCWLRLEGGKARLKSYFKKGALSALDILLLDDVSMEDRLWAVLRTKLIPAFILHEFACRCIERALKEMSEPCPRSLAAIKIKRLWLKGKATDEELLYAESAADETAATYCGLAMEISTGAAYATSKDAEVAAIGASEATMSFLLEWQIEELVKLLKEEEGA